MEYVLQICLQIYFSQSDTYHMVSLCVQMLSAFLQDKGINACDHGQMMNRMALAQDSDHITPSLV